MQVSEENTRRVKELIAIFYGLRVRDFKIVDELLDRLGLADIADLRICLENQKKNERDAALRQIEKRLDKLLSGNIEDFEDAKQDLKELFHPVSSPDEEA